MSALFSKPADLLLEIGQGSLKAGRNGAWVEIPLERSAAGLLTENCRQRVSQALGELGALNGARAVCALGARGVSIRRLSVPAGSDENLDEMVALQVESEFPLAPDQLAWGFCPVGKTKDPKSLGRDLVVVAVKRDVIQDYAPLLSKRGLTPVFTPGAWAGSAVCRVQPGRCGLLDVGRLHSELILYEEGVPTGLRSFSWGGETLTRALAAKLGMSRDQAEELKPLLGSSEEHRAAREAMEQSVSVLVSELKGVERGTKLFLTGGGANVEGMARLIEEQLGVDCERLQLAPGEVSVALAELERSVAHQNPLLLIEAREERAASEKGGVSWKWAALMCLLGLAVLSTRYWEVFLKKPLLERRVAEVKSAWNVSPDLERNLGFFQYMETNRPPYLETLEVVAEAAGRGTKIDSLSVDRRGDLSLKGTLPSSDQALKFRDQLIASGWFTNVVFEERTPMGNDRKLSVRMSARGKKPKAATAGAKPEKRKG